MKSAWFILHLHPTRDGYRHVSYRFSGQAYVVEQIYIGGKARILFRAPARAA